MDHYIQVLTTTDSEEHAEALARAAVEARLAACAQIIGPMRSIYRWNGTVRSEAEWQVVIKTVADRYPVLERTLRDVHTYDVPEIIALPISAGSEDYLRWISEQSGPE